MGNIQQIQEIMIRVLVEEPDIHRQSLDIATVLASDQF